MQWLGVKLSNTALMVWVFVDHLSIIFWLYCSDVLIISGFPDLEVVDQMALLKSAFMELNVFRLAYRWVGLKSHLIKVSSVCA